MHQSLISLTKQGWKSRMQMIQGGSIDRLRNIILLEYIHS